jgi:hypothetical protein
MNTAETAQALRDLAKDPAALQAAHMKMEDVLVDMRDMGILAGGPRGVARNGLAIFDKDGEPSPIIRIGTREAVAMVLTAVADYLADLSANERRLAEMRAEMGDPDE